jgi:hypothetical protein
MGYYKINTRLMQQINQYHAINATTYSQYQPAAVHRQAGKPLFPVLYKLIR